MARSLAVLALISLTAVLAAPSGSREGGATVVRRMENSLWDEQTPFHEYDPVLSAEQPHGGTWFGTVPQQVSSSAWIAIETGKSGKNTTFQDGMRNGHLLLRSGHPIASTLRSAWLTSWKQPVLSPPVATPTPTYPRKGEWQGPLEPFRGEQSGEKQTLSGNGREATPQLFYSSSGPGGEQWIPFSLPQKPSSTSVSRAGAVSNETAVTSSGPTSPVWPLGAGPGFVTAPAHPPCYVAQLDAPCIKMPEAMLRDAYVVLQCESGHNPRAVSKTDDWGLWQINRIHEARARRLGFAWEQMLEPGPNTAVAISIWEEQGFSPWSCRP